MRRWSITIAIVASLGSAAFAQESPDKGQMLSSDLVAWTSMQEPQQPEQQPAHQQPTPEPTPETRPPQNPTPSQEPSTPPSAEPQDKAQAKAPTAQTFTGTISKEADNFVLKVSTSTEYKLDNQQQVQQYEGQRVRVLGTLDPSINLIHVDRIEPIS